MSPDGRNVYAVALTDTLAEFTRNPVKLTAGHCYQTSTPKHCTPSRFERSGG